MKTPFNPLDPTLPRCEYRTVPVDTKPAREQVHAMLAAGWRIYRNGLFSIQLVRNVAR